MTSAYLWAKEQARKKRNTIASYKIAQLSKKSPQNVAFVFNDTPTYRSPTSRMRNKLSNRFVFVSAVKSAKTVVVEYCKYIYIQALQRAI